ncbi:ribonuclease III [Bacteroidales bacterium OttesenSCG-928-I21]|nr:ribonuclease III [Bacteroidales bacterium OttesenSCG-928-I21]
MFFLFRKKNPADKELKKKLTDIFGFKINGIKIYKVALRHSSANSYRKKKFDNNERLEFVGDAVFGTVVSAILYEKFPKATEGKLSVLRSIIVNRRCLNKIALQLQISQLITYRKISQYKAMKDIGGNTLEALIGAIYFDKGYDYCFRFVNNKIIDVFFDLDKLLAQNTDFKSKLLEYMQKYKIEIRLDTFENIEINERHQHFLTEIFINNTFVSEGKGWTKKDAEQVASQKALNIYKKIDATNFIF